MVLHHVLTVVLMMVSYSIRAFAFGFAVLITHEISDCLMYMTRLVRELTISKQALPIVFIAMVLTWTYTRSVIFISEVIYPLITQVVFEFDVVRYMFYLCVAGLLILGFLNTYWTVLIFNMGYKKLCKNENVVLKFEEEPKKEFEQ